MPAHLIKIDLSNLDASLRIMQHRRSNLYSVFFIDGEFIRVNAETHRGVQLLADRPQDLVGRYDWRVPIEVIRDDILHEMSLRLSGRG